MSLGMARLDHLVVLAAHCDDASIGAGATLWSLARLRPGLRVTALVMTGGGTPRAVEESSALAAFLPGSELEVTILDAPDGRLPQHWDRIKSAVEAVGNEVSADLVLAPHRGDAHQDHRLVAEIAPTVFRNHLILGYEIAKWESDLPRTNVYQPVSAESAREKVALLRRHYPSQSRHHWFDDEAFLGLMRLRGIQCNSRYAEAFVAEKILLNDNLKGS